MVRKLSLGSRRRWSKASRDGSLRENIAKADIRVSPRGISTSPERRSERESKRERSSRKRASADRSFRALPRRRAITSHSIGTSGKMESSGKYYARWMCEIGDQEPRLFRGKTPDRELLSLRQSSLIRLRRSSS